MADSRDHSRERDRSFRRDRSSRRDGGRDMGRDRSLDTGRDPRSSKASNNRVFVTNLPYESRWQDIKDLFRNEVGEVQFVELFVDERNKSKGIAVVEFVDNESVKKCLEVMNKYEFKNRKLTVKEDVGVRRDRYGAVITDAPRRDGRYVDKHFYDNGRSAIQGKKYETYGLSVGFLENLGIDPPIGYRIFIGNLSYDVSKKKVKEVFRLAGIVTNCDLPLDKDGRSRGFAIVEYSHPVEAVQAISMFNNRTLFDRIMNVRMDRAPEKIPDGLQSIGMGLGSNGEPLKCVAHNLPSLLKNESLQNNAFNSGSTGMLGGLQNNMQLANLSAGLGAALSGLNNPVLQAAGLNLLGSTLANSDLSSQLNNQAAQKQLPSLVSEQQLPSLVSQQKLPSLGSQQQLPLVPPANVFNNSNLGGRSGGDFASYSNQSSDNTNLGNLGFQSNNQDYDNSRDDKAFPKKVLVSGLPSSASYKLLFDKFSEFGELISFETKGRGSVLLTYETEWQAERAVKNLDKARVDGRQIDAILYF